MQNIVKYFKSCYEEEHLSDGIWNFTNTKVELGKFVKGKEELINNQLPYLPIGQAVGEQLISELNYYKKEKELVYCSLFVIGKFLNNRNKLQNLIAPLLLNKAEILTKNDYFYLSLIKDSTKVNPAILELIKVQNDENSVYNYLGEIPDKLSESSNVSSLITTTAKYLKGLDTVRTIEFPKLKGITDLKKLINNDFLQLVPASGFGLIKKSINTRNVISDLSKLSNTTSYSAPLDSFFYNKNKSTGYKLGHSPSILSDAQKHAIQSTNKNILSVIIGPPGTGKTHTIACLAIEQMTQGKSVLIVSKMNGAVDVIENKVFELIGHKGMTIRGGRKENKKALKDRLQFILSRGNITRSFKFIKKQNSNNEESREKAFLKQLKDTLKKTEQTIEERNARQQDRGKALFEYEISPSFFNQLKTILIKYQEKDKKFIWDLTDTYYNLLNEYIEATKRYTLHTYENKIANTVAHNRELLKLFLSSLRAQSAGKQQNVFEQLDLYALLEIFPIWLANINDVAETIPFEKELFDIVIIDEASQCDIATALPVLQRAKKAVIVGDPKQLNHISFISKARQKQLQEKYQLSNDLGAKLNYRDKSILDIAEDAVIDQSQISFLNEHYRSKPDIIKFSNHEYYFNELNIMTATPHINTDSQSLFWIKANGERNEMGYNPVEVKTIITAVKTIIKEEQKIPLELKSSIGILSPFRAQVDHIVESVKLSISINDFETHKVLIGSAHTFQGEERDIMFLSFALDNSSHQTSFRFLEKDDVLNVSITRAKNQQYVFTSFNPSNLKKNSVIRRFLSSIESKTTKHIAKNEVWDKFCDEVTSFLNKHNLRYHINFLTAGVEIDILIVNENKCIGIDLIGYPGQLGKFAELDKYRALLRAKIMMIPIAYTSWKYHRSQCELKILQAIH